MVIWSQKRKTGNTPTGPKKVKSKFLLGECCFFALMRVAFKSPALRARFAKVGFSKIVCVGVWVVLGSEPSILPRPTAIRVRHMGKMPKTHFFL